MMIATDPNNNVVLVGSSLPTGLNGVELTLHETTPKQDAAYYALKERAGTKFDGSTFIEIPLPPIPEPTPALTLIEQILASPADLAALKKALGL